MNMTLSSFSPHKSDTNEAQDFPPPAYKFTPAGRLVSVMLKITLVDLFVCDKAILDRSQSRPW